MVPTDVTSTWNVDHFEGSGFEGINYFQPGSSQLWDYIANDNSHLAFGYVVEFVPAAAVPAPAAFGGGILLLAGLGLRKATQRASSTSPA